MPVSWGCDVGEARGRQATEELENEPNRIVRAMDEFLSAGLSLYEYRLELTAQHSGDAGFCTRS